MVENSVFQQKRKKGKKKSADCESDIQLDTTFGLEEENEEEDEGSEEEDGGDEDSEEDRGLDKVDDSLYEWGKKIDPALRRWVKTPTCRCTVVDEHFENPPPSKCM